MVSASLILLSALATPDARQSETTFTRALAIGPIPSGGRTPCPTDVVALSLMDGSFALPSAGQSLALPNGQTRQWKAIDANKDGWFQDSALSGGYVSATVDCDKETVMALDATGHSMVYVNGEPRGGDVYAFGYWQLPVSLKKGRNHLLFAVGRGRLKARLTRVEAPHTVSTADPCLPDIVCGETKRLECSVIVHNATKTPYSGRLRCQIDGKNGEWWPVDIAPMTVRKVRFQTPLMDVTSTGQKTMTVSLTDGPGADPVSTATFTLEAKDPLQTHKRTFVSQTDGSVQYYAVQPASAPGANALVLSLHGASVEASGQAASYGQKTWCTIVCPTNGRPYGFDWEDWGRINALETLADARKIYKPSADRIYLTGHSMGGHGTWSVGMNHPEHWAAIAPCAGWISFWSYAGAADWKDPDPVEKHLRRAANASDTLKLLDNTRRFGVYVLHGGADETVPVREARDMRDKLGAFHKDFDWHEEPGQGHWYDTDPEPGANCQDHPPLFDFFARRRIRDLTETRFESLVTVSPDTNGQVGNVRLTTQTVALEPSRLDIRVWAGLDNVTVKTENAAAIEVRPLGQASFKVEVDGQEFVHNGTETLSLFRAEGQWTREGDVRSMKRPGTYGPFKRAFERCAALVYGSDPWSYAKARYDAETWAYRGNGSFRLVSDKSFDWAKLEPGRNVVLYGTPETNRAMASLTLPVKLEKGAVTIKGRRLTGDLGILLAFPNLKTRDGLVSIVTGTSTLGCRLTERLPYFLAGVHYPDVTVVSPELYKSASKGVVAAGWFGSDWSVERGDFAFRD